MNHNNMMESYTRKEQEREEIGQSHACIHHTELATIYAVKVHTLT